jgi:putative ABC transport system permease protein
MPGPSLTARETIAQGNRWRHTMIAVEAALSVFLLCGAGLVGQNLWKLISSSAGFDPRNVTVVQLRLPWRHERALNPTPMVAYREYLERVAAIPGVQSAAVVTGLPLRGADDTGFGIVGGPDDAGAMARQQALIQSVSPDYFQTLRIPLLSGRVFRNGDIVGRQAVAIVNREFVRRFGNGRDMLGRQILLRSATTIVGVVGDVRMSPLATAPDPQIYVSYLQVYEPNIYIVLRSSLAPAELLRPLKQAIHSVYSDQAVFHAAAMDDVLSGSVAEQRFQVLLIGAFALLALTMAASGMYSVVSCLVSQRTSEIAIRVALGANRLAIVKTVLGATVAWVAAGLTCGLALGFAARNIVRSLSSAETDGSVWMYALMALFFFAVTLLAAWMPVRRASRLDPAMALRSE